MKLNIFKRGFSLTELLIVLVIVAVLFAAMAPIMTKRKSSDTIANEPVWSFVTNAKDAFYDPGVEGLSSAAYFGINPNALSGSYRPYAKVYLRAKNNQNHIQFRYGEGNGTLTGLLSLDANGNLITSTAPEGSTKTFNSRGDNNTIAGLRAYANWDKKLNSSIGIGHAALAEPGADNSNDIAIGANSGQYLSGSNNILIGANTGRGKNGISDTVAIGGRVLSLDSSSGSNNVFVGYGVATAGFSSSNATKNTIVASGMYGGSRAKHNTIVGYEVYDGNFEYSRDVTAVGYNACNSIIMGSAYSNQGSKTCIGYASANNNGLNSSPTPANWSNDKFDHVFIGGTPNGFNGRSVLEIHNMDSTQAGTLVAQPNVAPTVVLNSNFVLRGNLYMPFADTGKLGSPAFSMPLNTVSSQETADDYCGRNCGTGRKKYRTYPKCGILGTIIGAIVEAIAAVIAIPTAGIGSVAFVTAWGAVAGGTIGSVFNPNGHKRAKEPASASAMAFGTQERLAPVCMDGRGYPTNTTNCPNLQLSDIRLKENITENTDALDKIMYVMPYNYTFKNDKSNTANVGVMAQDLKEFLPDSVFEGKDGYLGIQWDGMFYATINSIKKIDKDLDTLATNLSDIEADTDVIAKKHKSTQKRIDELTKRINKLENK